MNREVNVKEIKSSNNEYIKELAKLKIKKNRDLEKKFLVEGYHLIEMAEDYIETILISDIKDLNIIKNKKYILVTKEIINKLSQTQTPQGIIGVVRKKEEFIDDGNILVLDNVQDPSNVGTLIRSALSFNIQNIILSNDCVDIYNDKVIRGSQGSIFKINHIYCDLCEKINELKKKNYKIYGTSLKKAICIDEVKFENHFALILGNEGQGVSDDILQQTDCNLYIPISPQIDSLNVAVAGSILMYELTKQTK